MKTKTIFLSFLMGVLMLIATNTFAQSVDSVQNSNEEKITQDEQDKQRLQNAVDLRKETRASAKEARAHAKAADQVEDDAAYAAKEARKAARMEAKAQKNRDHADKQARKAARAIQKSNEN